jgi:hypothetical protein
MRRCPNGKEAVCKTVKGVSHVGSIPTLRSIIRNKILENKVGYTVGVAGQTVNLMPSGSGGSTPSPATRPTGVDKCA